MSKRGVTVEEREAAMSEGKTEENVSKEKTTEMEKSNPAEEGKPTADPVMLEHLVTIGMDKRLAGKVSEDFIVLMLVKPFL